MRSCSRSEAGVVATVRFGLAGAVGGATAVESWERLLSPQPASALCAHKSAAASETRRLIPLLRRRAVPSTFGHSEARQRSCFSPLFGHDLSGKPLHTFPDHARNRRITSRSRLRFVPP